jgi:hypothetical protein
MSGGGNRFQKLRVTSDNQNQVFIQTPDYEIKYQIFYGNDGVHLLAIYDKQTSGKWLFRLLEVNSADKVIKKLENYDDWLTLDGLPYLKDLSNQFPKLFEPDSLGFRSIATKNIVLGWNGKKFELGKKEAEQHNKKHHVFVVSNKDCSLELFNEEKAIKSLPENASISPDNERIAYIKNSKLFLYDLASMSEKEIVDLPDNAKTISGIKWSQKADRLAYVEKKEGGIDVVDVVLNKDSFVSTSKHPINYRKAEGNCLRFSDILFSFLNNTTIQYQIKGKSAYKYGFVNLSPKPVTTPYHVAMLGYNGFSKYYYGIKDQNSNLIDAHIQQFLIESSHILKPSISPNGDSFVYIVEGATNTEYTIQVHYPEATQNHTKDLLTLQLDTKSANLSNLVWSPDGSKAALVVTQSASAPFIPTTLYVLDVKNAKVLKKENVQLPMHCNHNGCTVKSKQAFWFKNDNSLQYKKGLSEPETETITLSLN